MEFIDPVVAQEELAAGTANTPASVATTETSSSNEQDSANLKTEQAVHRLEDEINNAYNVVETRFASLWSNASKNASELQERYKLEDRKSDLLNQLNRAKANLGDREIVQDNIKAIETQLKDLGEHVKKLETNFNYETLSTSANNALDSLDSTLESVEKQAGKYVNQFTSFFSSIVSIDAGNDDPSNSSNLTRSSPESETIFSSENYGSSRYETDLFKLHTTEAFYAISDPEIDEQHKKEAENFNVDDRTKEISHLLERYPNTLQKLMNNLVPVKVSYKLFWYRYFTNEDALKVSDQRRKELLARKNASDKEAKESSGSASNRTSNEVAEDDDDEEEFTWDDDEDEEDAVDVAKESNGPTEKKSGKTPKNDAEDDDDWE